MELVILFALVVLASPIVILMIIFSRLSSLSKRIDENFAADQADKLVLKRALERLRELEDRVQCLTADRPTAGTTTGPSRAARRTTEAQGAETDRSPAAVSTTAALAGSAGNDTRADETTLLREELSAPVEGAPAASSSPDSPLAPTADLPRERVTLTFPEASAAGGATGTAASASHPGTAPRRPTTHAATGRPASPATPRPLPGTESSSSAPFDWEALIGGNILNKVGAFILVIGLALFLYYSLDAFGPAAKLLIGLLAGGSLIVGGVLAERWGSAPMFVRGLFGAGWSAIYFTAYAAHGLAATRVIDDPIVSVLLLMIVAAGMIGHSLKFASEATTGLAFFIAFCGLAMGPLGRFTTFAATLLSASLLGLSFKFAWSGMVIFGTIAAYGFQVAHPAYSPFGAGLDVLLFNQLLLTAYWLGFEGFGVVQPSLTPTSSPRRATLFLLNALGYIGTSYVLWPYSMMEHTKWLWGTVTGLYLISGLLRHTSFKARPCEESEIEAAWAPSSDSVFCLAGAAGLMLTWAALPASLVAIGWGILSLCAIEAGLRCGFDNLRKMGHLMGVLAFGRLFLSNFTLEGHTSGISHRLLTVLPMVALYFQVFIRCAEDGGNTSAGTLERTGMRAYLYFPVILLVALARFELGRGLATPAWAGIALILQVIGVRWQVTDFRRQSVILSAITAAHAWGTDLRGLEASGTFAEPPFIGLVTILALYATQAIAPREPTRTMREVGRRSQDGVAQADPPPRAQDFEGPPTGIGEALENQGRLVFALTGSFVLAFLLYLKISGSLLSLAWAGTGSLLLIAGFLLRERPSRYTGLVLITICLGKLFFYDLQYLEVPFRILSFVILGLILMGISWVYSRFSDKIREYL